MDFLKACSLDDNQSFYTESIKSHASGRASRFLAILYLLDDDANPLARALLDRLADFDEISNLLMLFREIDALVYSLELTFVQKHDVSLELQKLIFALAPLWGIDDLPHFKIPISIDKGSVVRYPLLARTLIPHQQISMIDLVREVLAVDGTKGSLFVVPDGFTNWGIRVSVAASQPSNQGDEFQLVQAGTLPAPIQRQRILDVLNGILLVDYGLAISMSSLMRLYTVVPKKPALRQAGSVSSVPGWAWQDIDPVEDYDIEYSHLSVQMVHEFFHTKLYLIENSIPLYQGNGNEVTLFSPWKQRARPLRQVLHALYTFSAGAAVWMKLIELPFLKQKAILPIAEKYCRENLEFALSAQSALLELNSLTPKGKEFVENCVHNLKQVTLPLL